MDQEIDDGRVVLVSPLVAQPDGGIGIDDAGHRLVREALRLTLPARVRENAAVAVEVAR
jgi:hypothetical protein